jgi:hypothetical protein
MRNDTVSFSPDPRRWWVLLVLSASLLVIGLDNTILNVALPTLQSDLGSTGSQLQWIVDAYMLVFAGLLLTAGALGDRFGRKRALAFGLTIFGLGSGLSALATSPEMLIATRALMGIGGRSSCRPPCRSSPPSSPRTSGRRRSARGRRLGARHRHRPGGRRLADRALELARDLPRQPPFVLAALVAAASSSPNRRTQQPAARPARLRALDRRPHHAGVGDHRGADARLDRRRHRPARSPSPRSSSAPSWPGSCVLASRCSTCGCSATRASRARAARSRSCSSR